MGEEEGVRAMMSGKLDRQRATTTPKAAASRGQGAPACSLPRAHIYGGLFGLELVARSGIRIWIC
ncbi:hypothetical protein E2562_001815 [Oryza meyeriana var. granulata]|uniref:Uncharacterized protein n=1 Tax=Oryza meyeriana var. granulata TaxID=110450 RepID=A0A6G1CDE6_9ORYZ|nr:hypothetical protein E2562_001815 [Oryza meyeriana var. granulata]